jgi:hypothetical protein
MNISAILMLIAGPVFLASIIGRLWVWVYLRPKDDSDLDDYYHEFEDQHPGYARYTKWSKITYIAGIISALLLFLAVAI